VRKGVRPDGSRLYPAMPFPAYTRMSRDDVLAIRAYLKTVEPVHQPVKANTLPFPFNIRTAMRVWDALYFTEGEFQPDSPVRAFRAVGGTPRFISSAKGPYLTDVDGREYVDMVCSWGPMILGHAHPDVLAAVQAAALKGFSYGTPSENEVALAEEIVARVAPV